MTRKIGKFVTDSCFLQCLICLKAKILTISVYYALNPKYLNTVDLLKLMLLGGQLSYTRRDKFSVMEVCKGCIQSICNAVTAFPESD